MLFRLSFDTFFFADHGKLFLIKRLDGESASNEIPRFILQRALNGADLVFFMPQWDVVLMGPSRRSWWALYAPWLGRAKAHTFQLGSPWSRETTSSKCMYVHHTGSLIMKTRVAKRQEGRVLISWRPLDLGDLPPRGVQTTCGSRDEPLLQTCMRSCTCRSLIAFQLDRTRSSGSTIFTASMTFEPTQDSCCTF